MNKKAEGTDDRRMNARSRKGFIKPLNSLLAIIPIVDLLDQVKNL